MVIGADDAAWWHLVWPLMQPQFQDTMAASGENSNLTRQAGSLHGEIEAQTDIFGYYPKTIKFKPFTVSSNTLNEPISQTRKRRARLNARRRFAARCRQIFSVSQVNNAWDGGVRALSSSSLVPSSDRAASVVDCQDLARIMHVHSFLLYFSFTCVGRSVYSLSISGTMW